MMDINIIESTTLSILDQLPKQNIIGGTYEEIREGFKVLSDAEKISYAVNLAYAYANTLEREFKIHSILGILETVIGTEEAKYLAYGIRKGERNAIVKAGELIKKSNIKEKVVGKRNSKIEEILSKGEKIDV